MYDRIALPASASQPILITCTTIGSVNNKNVRLIPVASVRTKRYGAKKHPSDG